MIPSQTGFLLNQRLSNSREGVSRRRFLQSATGTAAAVTLAGCLGDDSGEDDPNNESTAGDDSTGSDGDPSPDVPDSFGDRDQLRQRSREYIRLLADGEFETAGEWVDPDTPIPFGATELEQVWTGIIGPDAALDSIDSVSYFGTERGNNFYQIRATLGGDRYNIVLSFSENGVVALQPSPILEWTPPAYVDEESFVEEEVTLETPLDCELGATATLPETDGQVPGVVIVHGNGPAGRDGTAGPNRTYKEIAWGLASRGIAVLRYDKRTFACRPDLADATIDDIVTEDALTAIAQLRRFDRVADDQVFVAGHSFGGGLAPRIAEMDGNLAGTVMLAPGPAGSFADLIVRQARHIYDLQPISSSLREQFLEDVQREAAKIRNLDIGEDEVVRFGGREFYESLQGYNQTGTAADLGIPQLLLQGGQDWQVTVEEDLPIWEDALDENETAEIVVYDDLNHLFQVSEGQRTQAEYLQDNPVDERVIEDISSFVENATEGSSPRITPLLAR